MGKSGAAGGGPKRRALLFLVPAAAAAAVLAALLLLSLPPPEPGPAAPGPADAGEGGGGVAVPPPPPPPDAPAVDDATIVRDAALDIFEDLQLTTHSKEAEKAAAHATALTAEERFEELITECRHFSFFPPPLWECDEDAADSGDGSCTRGVAMTQLYYYEALWDPGSYTEDQCRVLHGWIKGQCAKNMEAVREALEGHRYEHKIDEVWGGEVPGIFSDWRGVGYEEFRSRACGL